MRLQHSSDKTEVTSYRDIEMGADVMNNAIQMSYELCCVTIQVLPFTA